MCKKLTALSLSEKKGRSRHSWSEKQVLSLGAKLLVYGLWQNKGLQCEPEAHWPRKLPIWGRWLSLPCQSSWVPQRGSLAHKAFVTFFPLRSSSHPDHSSMASKDVGRLARMSCTPWNVMRLLFWAFQLSSCHSPFLEAANVSSLCGHTFIWKILNGSAWLWEQGHALAEAWPFSFCLF